MEEDYKKQAFELTSGRDGETQLAVDQAVKIQQLERHLKEAHQITQEKTQSETKLEAQKVI